MNIKLIALSFFAISILAACRKENTEPEIQPVTSVNEGVFVLNEGGWGANNASLSYYNFATSQTVSNLYLEANPGLPLGDLGQDMLIYGSKMYIVLNGSNMVEVVNKSGKRIKTIDMPLASPRYLASAKGKIFVTAYDDKVHVLDTATLTITKSIPVGLEPEMMAVVGEKLYVANSGGYNAPTFDNTVSVIDLNTLTEIKKIVVDINLNQIKADKYGDLYITSRGMSWGNPPIPSSLYVINTATDAIKKKFDIEATALTINGDFAYLYNFDYNTNAAVYTSINVKDETVVSGNFITDGSHAEIVRPYTIEADPLSGDIYIADAKNMVNNGVVYCFTKEGKKKYSFSAGVNPNKIIFNK